MVAYIDSPFQLLLLYFNSVKLHDELSLIIVRYNGNHVNDNGLDEIIAIIAEKNLVKIKKKSDVKYMLKIVYHLAKSRKVLLGDYRNRVSKIFLKIGFLFKKIYFIDDGAGTLNLANERIYRSIRQAKNITFYSIYRLPYLVDYNISLDLSDFILGGRSLYGLDEYDDFYVSQKFSEAGLFSLDDELKFVRKLSLLSQNMVIILHRGDSIEKRLKFTDMGIKYIELPLPLECYFKYLKRDVVIHGISSTCLYNAHIFGLAVKLYRPDVEVNPLFRKGFLSILKYYNDEICQATVV